MTEYLLLMIFGVLINAVAKIALKQGMRGVGVWLITQT